MTTTHQFIALTGDLGKASAAALSATVTTPTKESWTADDGISNLQGTPIPSTGIAGQILLPTVTSEASGQKMPRRPGRQHGEQHHHHPGL